jgi:hypothetical protein
MLKRLTLPLAGVSLALILAACSSAAGAVTDAAASTDPIAAASIGAAASTATTTTTTGKVSANTASEAEIAAALEAAGVPNAARWAREVTEYRPYPTDDPTLQTLQDNLAKYQPDAATLQAILSALEP